MKTPETEDELRDFLNANGVNLLPHPWHNGVTRYSCEWLDLEKLLKGLTSLVRDVEITSYGQGYENGYNYGSAE